MHECGDPKGKAKAIVRSTLCEGRGMKMPLITFMLPETERSNPEQDEVLHL